jgi:hypothetical protein
MSRAGPEREIRMNYGCAAAFDRPIIGAMDQSADANVMMSGYMEAALRSWSDEEFRARLAHSPREALAEAGWEVPAGVEIETVFFDAADYGDRTPPSTAELAEHWAQGIERGRLKLAFAETAPASLETTELSDDELTTVGGGHCIDGHCGPCL